MTQPSNQTYRIIKVLDSAGAGVTGLTIASFTVTGYARAYGAGSTTTYAHGAALTALGGGFYELAFAMPSSAGWWRLTIEHATNRVWNGSWEGEVETQDWDSLYGSIVQPIATLTTGAQLGMPLTLELVANRWRTLSIPVKDSAGNLYTTLGADFPSASLRIAIRSKDGTTTNWQAGPSATITTGGGTAANFAISTSGSTLSVTIPEDAGFFSALPAGNDTADLYWEVTGDFGGVASQTQPIIRSSPCRLTRKEVA